MITNCTTTIGRIKIISKWLRVTLKSVQLKYNCFHFGFHPKAGTAKGDGDVDGIAMVDVVRDRGGGNGGG